MIGHVISFDEINEADIRGEVMIAPRIEECFQGEEPYQRTEQPEHECEVSSKDGKNSMPIQ